MKKKKAIKYTRERFEWWLKWLGLGYGDVTLSIVDYIENEDENGTTYINPDLVGRCDTDWRYQKSQITLSLLKLRKLDEAEIEMSIVHELMHVFLNEMREGGIDHEERVATNLQKAFLWVRDAAKDSV